MRKDRGSAASGALLRPGRPCSKKRVRHFETVSRRVSGRAAISSFVESLGGQQYDLGPDDVSIRQRIFMGSCFASDERLDHAPGGLARHVGHDLSLTPESSKKLLETLDLSGELADEGRAEAREVTMAGHLFGRDEAPYVQSAFEELRASW
jgi:hypothetical protein